MPLPFSLPFSLPRLPIAMGNIPNFQLPAFVAKIGKHLPQWPHSLALVTALNAASKLKILPEEDLTALENHSFCVTALDTGGSAVFTYANGAFRPLWQRPDHIDVTLTANVSAYLQLLTRQEDPDTLFFTRALQVEGNTELGLLVKNMLDAIEMPRFKLPGFSH